jgi:diacylglycerol kinase family enzyme
VDVPESRTPDAGPAGREHPPPRVRHPRRVAVVFNPASGGLRSRLPLAALWLRLRRAEERAAKQRRWLRAALADAEVEVAWYETTPEDPGWGPARAAVKEGADLVIVCGGDGTVRACATALAGGQVPLAVLPGGTGNLLAANFDIPVDLDGALMVALECRRRRIDVGAHGDERFVVMAGMGFDAAMLRDTDRGLKSRLGPLAYVLSALGNLRRPRRRYQLRLDGRAPVSRLGQGILIGNVGKLRGGLPALPDAVPDDGLLDVAILKTRTVADWLALAWWVAVQRWRGDRTPPWRPTLRHRSRRVIETFRAGRIDIRCDRPQPTELDGDLRTPSRSLVMDVMPRALTLAVPAHHAEGTAPVRRQQ